MDKILRPLTNVTATVLPPCPPISMLSSPPLDHPGSIFFAPSRLCSFYPQH